MRFETAAATIQFKTGPYYTAVWKRAINAWNAKHVFKFRVVNSAAQITIVKAGSDEASLINKNYVGVAFVDHNTTNRITTVRLHLVHTLLKRYGYTTAQRVNVAEHELGHAMGLAHNPNRQSVMYKTTRYISIQPVDVASVRYHYSLPPAEYFVTAGMSTSQMTVSQAIISDALVKVAFNSRIKEPVEAVIDQ